MQVAGAGDVLGVIPPSHRFDIAIEQDLIEEVGAHPRLRQHPAQRRAGCRSVRSRRRNAPSRASACGCCSSTAATRKSITYSFVDPRLQRLMFPKQTALALENPLSAELGEMRVSLWPGLVETLRFNQRRQQDRVRIFEVGTRFEMSGGRLVESQAHRGTRHRRRVAGAVGRRKSRGGFLRHQVGRRGALRADRPAGRNKLCRGGARLPASGPQRRRSSTAILRVGWIGQLQPELARKLEMRDAPWVFEIGNRPELPVGSTCIQGDFQVPRHSARPGGRGRRIGDAGRTAGKC